MNPRTKSLIVTLIALMAFGSGGGAFAQDRRGGQTHERRQEHRGSFFMGVCVGQNLAQQGITLAPPTHGENYLNPSGDPTTEETVHAAIESCRTQFAGGPVPSGTSAPTGEPSAAPTAQPSTMPSIAPS